MTPLPLSDAKTRTAIDNTRAHGAILLSLIATLDLAPKGWSGLGVTDS
jgi:hypothetical protein